MMKTMDDEGHEGGVAVVELVGGQPYDDIENICYGKSKFSSTFITDESKH